jgi:hypothetical protein
VFIGSSSEGLPIAKTLQVHLDECSEVTVWHQGVFALTRGILESLLDAIERFDFAILVLTPDVLVESRGSEQEAAPRDNVLFELGLFIGSLGRERTFLVHDRSQPMKLPSDLAGISAATFQRHSESQTLESALGAPSHRIEAVIRHLGVRTGRERSHDSCGIKIVTPVAGVRVSGHIRVEGSFLRRPPDGSTLMIFNSDGYRHWPQVGHRVLYNDASKTWAGESYVVNDVTILAMLVRPNGQVLSDYYEKVGRETNRWAGIDRLPEDVLECDRVNVFHGSENE